MPDNQSAMNHAANRRATRYSFSEKLRRVLWAVAHPLFRFSPRVFFGWRAWLLRCFGATVGKEVHIYNTARITFPWLLKVGDWSAIGDHALIYNLGPITIGKSVTISQRAHLCAGTHDVSDPSMKLLKPPITVGDEAWICADAFVGPGVEVGQGAVVGARAVVVKPVEPWQIVAGNPARVIGQRELKPGD